MTKPATFSLAPGAKLHWRTVDGDVLAYDEGSGHTFNCDAATAAVLHCLTEGPAELSQITDVVANADRTASDNVLEILQGLMTAQLVARLHE
ncbi:MAG: hypothetical protein AAF493_28750 [Pseudomonadota bacterium]